MLHTPTGHDLQWTKSHPERIKPRMDWTADDQGIYMADLVAGELSVLHKEIKITTFTADGDALLNALVPEGQWVWTRGSQISGDTLLLITKNKKADTFIANENGFSINKTTEGLFNQLRGNVMTGKFTDGEIDYVRAKGNSESLYYLQDDDSAYVGMDYTQSDAISFKFIKRELKRITWVNGATGTTYPFSQIPEDKKELRNFKWLEALRPKSVGELFGR